MIDELKNQYSYDTESQMFTRMSDGMIMGCNSGVMVKGSKVLKARAIWMFVYNEEPSGKVGFIDGNSRNFSVENLELKAKKKLAKLANNQLILDMKSEIAKQSYDVFEHEPISIGGLNKNKLEDLGYILPIGSGYKWLIKVKDLIEIKSDQKVNYRCVDCGEACRTRASRVNNSKCKSCRHKGYVCTEEQKLQISLANKGRLAGSKNPNYNPTLTAIDRIDRRTLSMHRKWAIKVKQNANFICEACEKSKSGQMESHHKDGYANVPSRRTDETNGVCLCHDCHKEFHSIYGRGKNTVDQFEEWILNKLEEREVA